MAWISQCGFRGNLPRVYRIADDRDLTVTQRISGVYRLITVPTIHKGLMFWLGADTAITRYVNEILQPLPGMKMLDVGCGPANILAHLPPLDYTGIDLNEKHIVYA
jgi:2-polyprenyl-3-methyl-5-hydroxy-6-metoxy-1,4-benzoquinol methylase